VNNRRLCTGHGKLPDSHTKEHPRAILFVTLYGATSVQTEQEVRLHYFKRLVAMLRNAEREFLGDVSEFKVQIGLFGVKLCGDGADWKW